MNILHHSIKSSPEAALRWRGGDGELHVTLTFWLCARVKWSIPGLLSFGEVWGAELWVCALELKLVLISGAYVLNHVTFVAFLNAFVYNVLDCFLKIFCNVIL